MNPQRVFFVGRNLGGGVGGFWMTKEDRIYASIIAGAIPELTQFWTASPHPAARKAREGLSSEQLEQATRVLSSTDLINTLPKIKNRELFLQYGKQDDWITESSVNYLYGVAKEPKDLKWLEDDHEMNSRQATMAREAWIKRLAN